MNFDFTQQPGMNIWKRDLAKNEQPLISIITPFYNDGKYILQTFNCVVNQTFPWFEWIIVDDGSTDEESLEILNQLPNWDSRIKLIHQKNGGLSSARNKGIEISSTDLIFPFDSDDLIEPTCLEYEYWALHFNPKATWAYTDSVGFEEQEYLWEMLFDPQRMRKENLITATALIRKEAAIKIGGYTVGKESFNEDWHFWLRLLVDGAYPIQIRKEHLFWYRRKKSGMLTSIYKDTERAKRNRKIIEEEANNVISPSAPVYYPQESFRDAYQAPALSDWKKRIYETHSKIHVSFLLPWLMVGGADNFNLNLIAGLDKEKYEVSILTTIACENEWIQKFREYVADIFNLPNFLAQKDFPEFISYFLKTRETDILFVSNSYLGYYMIPWLRQHFPELVIVDCLHMETRYWRNGGYARANGVMKAFLEHTYVGDTATQDTLIKKFGQKQEFVSTVHIGVDSEFFSRKKVRSGIIYQQLGLEKSRPIVLFICRLTPEKRPFLMLEIAKEVSNEIPDVAFVVVGDGNQKDELIAKTYAKGLENTVYFVGTQDEIRPYYRDAKVMLLCSMKEGLSLTTYESCAMGTPVVSANAGGQKDLVDDTVGALIPLLQHEETDFDKRVFSKKEIINYTEAIVHILKDDSYWEKLSEACVKKVKQNFTISSMVQYYDSEFERLMHDVKLKEERQKISAAMQLLSPLAADIYTMELLTENSFIGYDGVNFGAAGNNTAIINHHEEVINRHEEVVNRHEEVVNRHEESINHQWEIQKWHEERLEKLEQKSIIRKVAKKIIS